jgi:hypothetical protein
MASSIVESLSNCQNVKPEIEVMDLRLEKKGSNETGNSEKCGDKTNCNTRNGTDNSATAIGYQSETI